ncbi:MAG: hypothetical protein U9Q35_00970 [Pseudomonadota bacterium]|nr:hypothetical protein [Pseudomonadota bacterium]
MKQAHAHLVTRVNASQIKKEVIDGEDHYRIPSATLPDNVVMNGGLYGADEIEAAYKGLEGTPAPLGHPMVGNEFVSALSPRAMNKYSVGAWNENVRRTNGRVLLDKVVNIRVANQTEGGKQLLAAIDKQAPIHTSTGLMLEMEVANGESNGKPYKWIARNMRFDHDAILLDEPGAATPEDGVGMFVNSAGERLEVMTGNLDLTEGDEYTLEAMAEELVHMADRAERREKNKGLIDKVVTALKSAIGGAQTTQAPVVNHADAPEGDMSLTKEDVQAVLNEALKPYGEKLDTVNTKVAAIETAQKEQGESVKALKANADAAAKAESAKVDAALKEAGFEDADLEGMSVNAKQKILAKQQPQGFHLNAAFGGKQAENTDTLPE